MDRTRGFETRVEDLVQRAKVRRGALSNLCGLNVDVPRTASRVPLVLLVRYGMTMVESGAFRDLFTALGTESINVTARRNATVGRSPCRPILNIAAGLVSTPNLYIRQRALTIGRAPRAESCILSVSRRGNRANTSESERVEPDLPGGLEPRTCVRGFMEYDLREE